MFSPQFILKQLPTESDYTNLNMLKISYPNSLRTHFGAGPGGRRFDQKRARKYN